MRFQVTRALDAIESRMRTDPLLAGAVVDLSEAARLPGPDGRPANVLRLGFVIDALSRYLADESVAVYAVDNRGLLSDTDLTSNERMALRRWSDDGRIEIIPAGAPALSRVCEIAWNLGLPVITSRVLAGFPGGKLVPAPTAGSMMLVEAGKVNTPPRQQVSSRLWRCPAPECPSFSQPGPQAPPQMSNTGVPLCPRHGERLTDVGPRPRALALALRVEGLAKYRFPLVEGAPLTIGRCPEGPGAVGLGPYLSQQIGARVSRSHIRVELREGTVVVTDISSNGSLLQHADGPRSSTKSESMTRGKPCALGEWDGVELAEGIEIGRADRRRGGQSGTEAASVMQEAPTVAIRLPNKR